MCNGETCVQDMEGRGEAVMNIWFEEGKGRENAYSYVGKESEGRVM